ILGEATINLADYVDASQPAAISLPLVGSDHGTILHVSIQLLTAKTGFREFEQQRDNGLQSGNNVDKETEPNTARSSSSELEMLDDREMNKCISKYSWCLDKGWLFGTYGCKYSECLVKSLCSLCNCYWWSAIYPFTIWVMKMENGFYFYTSHRNTVSCTFSALYWSLTWFSHHVAINYWVFIGRVFLDNYGFGLDGNLGWRNSWLNEDPTHLERAVLHGLVTYFLLRCFLTPILFPSLWLLATSLLRFNTISRLENLSDNWTDAISGVSLRPAKSDNEGYLYFYMDCLGNGLLWVNSCNIVLLSYGFLTWELFMMCYTYPVPIIAVWDLMGCGFWLCNKTYIVDKGYMDAEILMFKIAMLW
ncbi:hypothetical protein Tco_0686107, partial [Tanacetum coccineum]